MEKLPKKDSNIYIFKLKNINLLEKNMKLGFVNNINRCFLVRVIKSKRKGLSRILSKNKLLRSANIMKQNLENHQLRYLSKSVEESLRGNDFFVFDEKSRFIMKVFNEILILIILRQVKFNLKNIKFFILLKSIDLFIDRILIPFFVQLLIDYIKNHHQ